MRHPIRLILVLTFLWHGQIAKAAAGNDTIFASAGDTAERQLLFAINSKPNGKDPFLLVTVDNSAPDTFALTYLKEDNQLTVKKASDILKITGLFGVRVSDIEKVYSDSVNSSVFTIINKVNKISDKRQWIIILPPSHGKAAIFVNNANTSYFPAALLFALLSVVLIAIILWYRTQLNKSNSKITPPVSVPDKPEQPEIKETKQQDTVNNDQFKSDYNALTDFLAKVFYINARQINPETLDAAINSFRKENKDRLQTLQSKFDDLNKQYDDMSAKFNEQQELARKWQTTAASVEADFKNAEARAQNDEQYYNSILANYTRPFYDYLRKNGAPYPPGPEIRRLFAQMIIAQAFHFESFIRYKKNQADVFSAANVRLATGESETEVMEGKEFIKITTDPDKGKVPPQVVYVAMLMKDYGLDEIYGLNIDGYIIRKE